MASFFRSHGNGCIPSDHIAMASFVRSHSSGRILSDHIAMADSLCNICGILTLVTLGEAVQFDHNKKATSTVNTY